MKNRFLPRGSDSRPQFSGEFDKFSFPVTRGILTLFARDAQCTSQPLLEVNHCKLLGAAAHPLRSKLCVTSVNSLWLLPSNHVFVIYGSESKDQKAPWPWEPLKATEIVAQAYFACYEYFNFQDRKT